MINTPLKIRRLSLLGLLFALPITSHTSRAADRIWAPGVSGKWDASASWQGGQIPVTDNKDQASLTTGGTTTLDTDAGTVTALLMGATDGTAANHLLINNGGNLTAGASTSSIRSGSTITINNGGTFTASSILNVGNAAGSGSITINTGGLFDSTGYTGSVSYLRFGTAGGTGAITVNGGEMRTRQTFTLGYSNNSTATLTLKNGGHYQGSSGLIYFGASASTYTGVTATLNIGGETIAEIAGTIAGVSTLRGYGGSNVNTLNFNHTSARHAFVNTGTGNALLIQDLLTVNQKAGVTVLNGANTYSRGTTISGGTLLANYTGSTVGASSTGSGDVNVLSGATLAGIGKVLGATTVSGVLKPGDYDYGATMDSYQVLTFGDDVILTDTATLAITLNGDTRGTSYSGLDVAGDLTLDGTLQITLNDDFAIADGQTLGFELFRMTGSGDILGGFDSYLFADSYHGLNLTWNTADLPFTGWVEVTAEAIPEPATSALLIGAGLLLALRRRRA